MNKVLEVKDLHFQYGAIKALHGISIDVYEGEVVTILGANGAGKTTAVQAISGLVKGITGGEIIFNGNKIDHVSPHKIAKLGIAQCIEGRHIYNQLTVAENLQMGAYMRKAKETAPELEYVYSLFPRLYERRKQKGGTLSGGEQQMLAVGRALMQKPKMMLMDEPSLGLAPIFIETIFETIKKINDNGMTILLVEQNTDAALNVADRGYVLENGEIRLSGDAKDLLNNDDIRKSYLGAD